MRWCRVKARAAAGGRLPTFPACSSQVSNVDLSSLHHDASQVSKLEVSSIYHDASQASKLDLGSMCHDGNPCRVRPQWTKSTCTVRDVWVG